MWHHTYVESSKQLSRLKESHQHIRNTHRDSGCKWKPIKGENHNLLLLWCKGKLQLPLTTVFCRHQPTGGSNLSQLQLTTVKLQLDREAPTSSIYQTECLLIYLRYQLCSIASLSALLFLIFSASLFCILPSLYLLSLLPQKKNYLHI